MTEVIYTVEAAAAKLCVHKMTLYTQIRKGQFQGAVNVERNPDKRPKWQVPESAINAHLATGTGNGTRRGRAPTGPRPDSEQKVFQYPDSIKQRHHMMEMIDKLLPRYDRDKNRMPPRAIVSWSTEVVPGPEVGYLGAYVDNQAIVIEVDEFGDAISAVAKDRHSLHPAACEAATGAWRAETIMWRQGVRKLAVQLKEALGEDHPITLQALHMVGEMSDRELQEEMLRPLIVEICKCS